MTRWIYNLIAIFTNGILTIVSKFNQKNKISKILFGRKNSLVDIQNLNSSLPKIWIHTASLGEFEMAIPLILELNQQYHCCITFFSPSGFENAQLPQNCSKYYLQNDSISKAKQWIKILDPQIAIFVKYEFWINHLHELNSRQIPFVYWNILLRKNHFLGSFWGQKWRSELNQCKKFFAQNLETEQLLKKWISPKSNVEVLGDARYLRAAQLRESAKDVPPSIIEFCQHSDVLILGSCWDEEVEVLRETLSKLKFPESYRYIVAPHDLSEARIQKIQKTLSNPDSHVFRFSQISDPSEVNVPRKEKINIGILDSIGWLSRTYHWGDIALVGGGFGKGLHNIIEPLAAGCFVLFGPETDKFPEAIDTINADVAAQGNNILDLSEKLANTLNRDDFHELRGQVNQYFNQKIKPISQAKNEICNYILTN